MNGVTHRREPMWKFDPNGAPAPKRDKELERPLGIPVGKGCHFPSGHLCRWARYGDGAQSGQHVCTAFSGAGPVGYAKCPECREGADKLVKVQRRNRSAMLKSAQTLTNERGRPRRMG